MSRLDITFNVNHFFYPCIFPLGNFKTVFDYSYSKILSIQK